MLDYSIMTAEGIVVLRPHGPLTQKDFDGLSVDVDSYLSDHAKIHGLLIQSKEFPGWQDFAGFTAHLHFVHQHHKNVERVAVVTDSKIADMAESLANHFTSAEVRHFPFADNVEALRWLETA